MNLKQAIQIAIPILDRERKTLIVPAQYAKFGSIMPRAVGAKKRLDDITEAIRVLSEYDPQPNLFDQEETDEANH